MIFLCTRGALYNMDDLFSFAPQYLQWAGVAPADMIQRLSSPNTQLCKIWTNEGAQTVSAILRPQLTVTCNILETSCVKRTKNEQQNDKSGIKLHHSPVSQNHSLHDMKWLRSRGSNWYVCVSALERWRQSHLEMVYLLFQFSCCWIKERWSKFLPTKTGLYSPQLLPDPLEDVEFSYFLNHFRPFGSWFYRMWWRTSSKIKVTWSRVVSVFKHDHSDQRWSL